MDILIVKLGALGDVINTLPLVINLKKHFNAHIHWLVEPLSFPIISGHPCVDNTIIFDKHLWRDSFPEVFREIRKQPYDITLDLQRIVKSGIFSTAAKTSRRIGFDKARCKEMTWLLPYERIPASGEVSHMIHQYLEFAQYLGVKDRDVHWDIPVSGNIPFNLPLPYVVLNIGATKQANKWTAPGFALLADMLMDIYKIPSVLTGAKEDMEMAYSILAQATPGVINLAGKTTIHDLKEIIAGSSVVVSCDTGPMHLAVALGKAVVALFGPADPRRTGPYKGEVIQKDLPCIPCNKRHCNDAVCMKSITPEDVMERIEKIWGRTMEKR